MSANFEEKILSLTIDLSPLSPQAAAESAERIRRRLRRLGYTQEVVVLPILQPHVQEKELLRLNTELQNTGPGCLFVLTSQAAWLACCPQSRGAVDLRPQWEKYLLKGGVLAAVGESTSQLIQQDFPQIKILKVKGDAGIHPLLKTYGHRFARIAAVGQPGGVSEAAMHSPHPPQERLFYAVYAHHVREHTLSQITATIRQCSTDVLFHIRSGLIAEALLRTLNQNLSQEAQDRCRFLVEGISTAKTLAGRNHVTYL